MAPSLLLSHSRSCPAMEDLERELAAPTAATPATYVRPTALPRPSSPTTSEEECGISSAGSASSGPSSPSQTPPSSPIAAAAPAAFFAPSSKATPSPFLAATTATASLAPQQQGSKQRGRKQPRPKSVCQDFLRGKCQAKRDQCRFHHPDEAHLALVKEAHVCEIFAMSGSCRFGRKCHRPHRTLEEVMAASARTQRRAASPPPAYRSPAVEAAREALTTALANPSPSDACRSLLVAHEAFPLASLQMDFRQALHTQLQEGDLTLPACRLAGALFACGLCRPNLVGGLSSRLLSDLHSRPTAAPCLLALWHEAAHVWCQQAEEHGLEAPQAACEALLAVTEHRAERGSAEALAAIVPLRWW